MEYKILEQGKKIFLGDSNIDVTDYYNPVEHAGYHLTFCYYTLFEVNGRRGNVKTYVSKELFFSDDFDLIVNTFKKNAIEEIEYMVKVV